MKSCLWGKPAWEDMGLVSGGPLGRRRLSRRLAARIWGRRWQWLPGMATNPLAWQQGQKPQIHGDHLCVQHSARHYRHLIVSLPPASQCYAHYHAFQLPKVSLHKISFLPQRAPVPKFYSAFFSLFSQSPFKLLI